MRIPVAQPIPAIAKTAGAGIKSATLACFVMVVLAWHPVAAHAQIGEACGDDCKLNSNLAVVVNVPLEPMARVTTPGWGGVAGVGYNFNKRHAFVGELMWNRLYPEGDSMQPLRAVLNASNLNGYTDFFVMTGNYRLELRGRFFGTYLIGGGGLYVRYAHLSQSVTVFTSGTPCTQTWLWWGFSCTAGFVNASQTLASRTSSALGGNAGGGMTFRTGDAPYRVYVEARYHYAPTQHISTQFVTVAFGLRF